MSVDFLIVTQHIEPVYDLKLAASHSCSGGCEAGAHESYQLDRPYSSTRLAPGGRYSACLPPPACSTTPARFVSPRWSSLLLSAVITLNLTYCQLQATSAISNTRAVFCVQALIKGVPRTKVAATDSFM